VIQSNVGVGLKISKDLSDLVNNFHLSVPPHQRETIEGLDSIYDISHVRENSLLLDTQCGYIQTSKETSVICSDHYVFRPHAMSDW